MKMKMKAVISIFVVAAFAFGAFSVLAVDTTPITLSGTGSVTITNAAPSVSGISINDGSNWVTSLDVDTEYDFYVNVTDANTLDDIANVTLELWVLSHETDDSSTYRYKFEYTETAQLDGVFAGTWTQTFPTTGTWLNNGTSTVPAVITANSGSYVFKTTLNKTAMAGNWRYNATVTDSTGLEYTIVQNNFNVYKYLEMTYDNGGSMDFAWTAATGAIDVADTFDVTVTSNTAYTYSAAYENRFYNGTTSWANEPSLEIKYGASAKVAVTNATASFADWATFAVQTYNSTTSHTLYLDVESVLPTLTYSGVTIYIRATV